MKAATLSPLLVRASSLRASLMVSSYERQYVFCHEMGGMSLFCCARRLHGPLVRSGAIVEMGSAGAQLAAADLQVSVAVALATWLRHMFPLWP
jgi:hypothetical protein